MEKRVASFLVATVFVLLALCVSFQADEYADAHRGMSAQSEHCCAVVASGFVPGSSSALQLFFAVVSFTLAFTFFVLPKITSLPYRPPRY